MRVNIYSDEGVLERKKVAKGSTLTDFLTLLGDPVIPADATTKRYTDEVFASLNTDNIVSGNITETQLPAMSGDAVSSAGTSVVDLLPITSAGMVVNPVVNAKGLITGSGSLSGTALPELDWSVVSDGTPTSVVGYGIMDAVNTTGGIIDVNITLSDDPTTGNEAATKQYVDTVAQTASGGSGLSVGDIIIKVVDTTPTGFLQCNGGLVSKTTYTALYDLLKTDYDTRMISGAGKPWVQQYMINLNNNLEFGSSSSGTLLAATSAYGQVVVTRNKAFLFGGSNGFNLSNIQTATINANGTLSAWNNLTMGLPSGMKHFQVVTTKNRVYLLGGVGAGNSNNSILYSPISTNGDLGSWVVEGNLPTGVSGHRVFITSSRVYILGGSVDGNATGVVNTYYAPINSDGSLGTWTAGPDLPNANQFFSIAITENRVYVLGGHTGTVTLSAVVTATIDADGVLGDFSIVSYLPQARTLGHSLVTDKFVYYLGGTQNNNMSGVSPEIMRAPIDSSGVLGNWVVVTGSCAVRGGEIISLLNNVHIVGGVDGSNNYLNTSLVYNTSNSGGLNDYYDYYSNPLFSSQGADLFAIPDLSTTIVNNGNYYIKY